MADEESAAHAALLVEYRALEEEYSGQHEYPEEIDARLGELEVAMEVLEQYPLIFDPAEVFHVGVFVTPDRNGSLVIYRGYVRSGDEPREDSAVQCGGEVETDEMAQGGDAGVSDRQPAALSGAEPSSPRLASRSAQTCPRMRMTGR